MFSTQDVAEYYNTTQNHYEKWWDLKNSLSLHYGIWESQTKTFSESLANTNKIMMEVSKINGSEKILDAGCGVGGAAIFLATHQNVEVLGITLSQKQVSYANNLAKEKKLDHKISFQIMDYAHTTFANETFDIVWACESVASASDKIAFIKEAYRVLKKGGKLILNDCFLTDDNQIDKNKWMLKWGQTWGVTNFVSVNFFTENLTKQGFSISQNIDFTHKIQKSAKRMYYAALLAFIPCELYNLLHPKVTRFAKTHYKCGYYQYKALKQNLWKYRTILAIK